MTNESQYAPPASYGVTWFRVFSRRCRFVGPLEVLNPGPFTPGLAVVSSDPITINRALSGGR